ncbi:TIGR04222 domain-containing membrane protein [Tautonia sp. JC769]|uniref:TIGR04222 domain-containing membrane protein n=1 Tax=Tautonia sp. JC769 TaxID=3232135 RepID=UPI00345A6B3D
MNPLNLNGPDFLALYVTLLMCVVTGSLILRWMLRTPIELGPESPDLDEYRMAHLAERGNYAVNAAIASLVQAGALAVNRKKRTFVAQEPPPEPLDELERTVLSSVKAGGAQRELDAIYRDARPVLHAYRDDLIDLGLVVDHHRARVIQLASGIPVLLLLVLGLMKIQVGLARDRPVGFLVALCVLTAVFGAIFLFLRPHHTRRGYRLLERLRRSNYALKKTSQTRSESLQPREVARAVALFGTGVLVGGLLDPLRLTLDPPSSSSGGGPGGGGDGGGGGGGCGGCGGGGG